MKTKRYSEQEQIDMLKNASKEEIIEMTLALKEIKTVQNATREDLEKYVKASKKIQR